MQVMRNLSNQVDLRERDIIRFIAEGLTDEEQVVRELRSATNFRRPREKIQFWEESKMLRSTKRGGQGSEKPKPKNQVSAKRRCYNCSSPDHELRVCPEKAKGRKCYKCSQFWHVATECKKNTTGAAQGSGGQVKRVDDRKENQEPRVRVNHNWKMITLKKDDVLD